MTDQAHKITLSEYIDKHDLEVGFDLQSGMAGLSPRHFRATIRKDGREYVTEYTLGPGHHEDPEGCGLLGCIAMDNLSVEGLDPTPRDISTFWCGDWEEGRRVYFRIKKEATRLKAVLGGDAFDELIHGVEDDDYI